MTLGSEVLLAVAGGAWVFLGSAAVSMCLGRLLGWDRATVACLVLTSGLGNTSFVGLPVIRILVGDHGLGPALVFDQLGSFVPLAVGGVLAVAWGRGENVAWGSMARRLFAFPPTIALLIALAIRGVVVPLWLTDVLAAIGATLSPLALLAVGLGSTWRTIGEDIRPLVVGLSWKLVLAPAGVLVIASLMEVGPIWRQVGVLQSGMAPMVTGGIVASAAGLRPELASRMVLWGLFASALTLPIWAFVT